MGNKLMQFHADGSVKVVFVECTGTCGHAVRLDQTATYTVLEGEPYCHPCAEVWQREEWAAIAKSALATAAEAAKGL